MMMHRKRSMASLFVGINANKASPDADPARSPTSPLDHTIFSNLGNPFAISPRSPRIDSPRRSWDSARVGLGLVDALLDSKSIVFGPQMRTCRVLPGSHEKIADEIQAMSCPSGIDFVRRDRKSNTRISGSPPVNVSSSLPLFLGSISGSEIEMSEDYTRIITHGPNPKTTHIFGGRVLEEDPSEHINLGAKVSSWVVKCAEEDPFPSLGSGEFLSSCCSCGKKLGDGDDIYMYRGEKAFCSSDCRGKEILREENTDEEGIPLMV